MCDSIAYVHIFLTLFLNKFMFNSEGTKTIMQLFSSHNFFFVAHPERNVIPQNKLIFCQLANKVPLRVEAWGRGSSFSGNSADNSRRSGDVGLMISARWFQPSSALSRSPVSEIWHVKPAIIYINHSGVFGPDVFSVTTLVINWYIVSINAIKRIRWFKSGLILIQRLFL